jgi:hypothetical protein
MRVAERTDTRLELLSEFCNSYDPIMGGHLALGAYHLLHSVHQWFIGRVASGRLGH